MWLRKTLSLIFMKSWLEVFVSEQIPESSLGSVDLEETRRNILESPALGKEEADKFWDSLKMPEGVRECPLQIQAILAPIASGCQTFHTFSS